MRPVINLDSPISGLGGKLLTPWNMFFQWIVKPPDSFDSIAAIDLPFTASDAGNFLISGGTSVVVTLTRGNDIIPVPSSGFVPMGFNDTISITYVIPPTMRFIPS